MRRMQGFRARSAGRAVRRGDHDRRRPHGWRLRDQLHVLRRARHRNLSLFDAPVAARLLKHALQLVDPSDDLLAFRSVALFDPSIDDVGVGTGVVDPPVVPLLRPGVANRAIVEGPEPGSQVPQLAFESRRATRPVGGEPGGLLELGAPILERPSRRVRVAELVELPVDVDQLGECGVDGQFAIDGRTPDRGNASVPIMVGGCGPGSRGESRPR